MQSVSILIALNSEGQTQKLKNFLSELGYNFLHSANSSQDLLRKARTLKPDICISDFETSQYSGYEAAKVIVEDGISTVILLVNETQHAIVEQSIDNINLICLNRPLSKSILANTIEITLKNQRKIKSLENQIEKLKSSLDSRKMIDKAKSLLIKHDGLNENDAFRKIQKKSMDSGLPMKEVAEKIIIQYNRK